MTEYYEGGGRETEILSTNIIEQHEITDYSLYNDMKEKYNDITIEEFGKITDYATVRVDYSLKNGDDVVVLDDELVCIKMDGQWYVLSDGAFTN